MLPARCIDATAGKRGLILVKKSTAETQHAAAVKHVAVSNTRSWIEPVDELSNGVIQTMGSPPAVDTPAHRKRPSRPVPARAYRAAGFFIS
jgi:hypothetical protein